MSDSPAVMDSGVCLVCHKQVGNLGQHWRKHHPKEYAKVRSWSLGKQHEAQDRLLGGWNK